MNDSIRPIAKLVKEFSDAQHRYANLGAWDTEPDQVWHCILKDAVDGKPYPGIETATHWQLFSEMKGAAAAAKRLTLIAKRVHAKVLDWRESMPVNQWADIEQFIGGYAWRA